MDCICTLQYEPVCVGEVVYSNACIAACRGETNITGWYNDRGTAGTHACSDYKDKNENCGGFTPIELESRCNPLYECVNTMGQFIADAPGKCLEPCVNGLFDHYGNCIPKDCNTWFDGCNNCIMEDRGYLTCTERFCDMTPPENATCLDDDVCVDVNCPRCEYGNTTIVPEVGSCCGCDPDPNPPICCLAMIPSCLACSAKLMVSDWCLQNQASQWFNDDCAKFREYEIDAASLRTICEQNFEAENCIELKKNLTNSVELKKNSTNSIGEKKSESNTEMVATIAAVSFVLLILPLLLKKVKGIFPK